jgi:hypothetical protein
LLIEALIGASEVAAKKELEDSLRREHAREMSSQIKLFSDVVASPSFRIGKAVTTLAGKIPAVRPAYKLLRKN